MTQHLGIDVGASGLRVFDDSSGNPIATIDAPNSSKNREQDLVEALQSLSKQLPQLKAQSACIGMSGFSSLGVSAKQIADELARLLDADSLITSDMVTAHYAHFGESDGVAVVIGTGALAFGISGGKHLRIDGLGASLGDFGSAYWIGLKALRSSARASEISGEKELLTSLEEEVGDSASWPRLFAKHELTEFMVARLSRKVSQLGEQGNQLAAEILAEAGELAAESAIGCARRIGATQIGYGGSVLLGSKIMRDSFLSRLTDAVLDAEQLKSPSGVGAWQIADAGDSDRRKFLISEGLAYFQERVG